MELSSEEPDRLSGELDTLALSDSSSVCLSVVRIELPAHFELESCRLWSQVAEMGNPMNEGVRYHDSGLVLIMCVIDCQLELLLKEQDW